MKLENGITLNVIIKRKQSNKPVTVFIHGDDQNNTIWKSVEKYFSDKSLSVLSYDLPGHGLSDPYKDEDNYSYQSFVQTLKEVLNKNDVNNFILIGNSTGGIISLSYAAQNHKSGLKAVVAISSCDENPVKHVPKLTEKAIERMSSVIIENKFMKSKKLFKGKKLFDYSNKTMDVIQSIEMKYTQPSAIKGNLLALKNLNLRLGLKDIKVPVLYIKGSDDNIITNEWIERIDDDTPNSRLVIINGHGHHVLLEDPNKVIECIDDNYSFLLQE